MKKLIGNEWYILWKRKTAWLMYAAIPMMVYASAKYMQYQNTTTMISEAHYAVLGNFPILGLSEMLMTAFNFILVVLVAMMITDPYQSGQLRMILIRTYSFRQIIIAKFIVVMGFMFMYLFVYLLCCYVIGWFMFTNPSTYPQFYSGEHITLMQGFIYNLKFYGIAYLTLLAFGSIVFFIAMISHTTTTTIGTGIGILFFSFMYPNIIQLFGEIISKEILLSLFFTSIPMIQWQGLTLLLAGPSYLTIWMIVIISCYIVLFQCFIIYSTRLKKDYFI